MAAEHRYCRFTLSLASERSTRVHALLSRAWSDDQGQDLIEYALMLTLILLVSVAAIQGIGTSVSNIFNSVNATLTT